MGCPQPLVRACGLLNAPMPVANNLRLVSTWMRGTPSRPLKAPQNSLDHVTGIDGLIKAPFPKEA